MAKKNHQEKTIEIIKDKPRKEEEKFFISFSKTQTNVIMLLILSATFLVQGIIRYVEFMGTMSLIRPWFFIIISALIFLVLSVFTISIDNIASPLRIKRQLNLISFFTFIVGFVLFLVSFVFLFFII